MAIDVLQFNEQKKQNDLYRQNCINTVYATVNSFCTQLTNTSCALALTRNLSARPWDTTLHTLIPTLPSVTCGFKVCDTNEGFFCGVCCLWTVPSGYSSIRFQLWGAGAPSAQVWCCGMSFASSGAYASVIIPAVAGCQYTLCSACACQFCCSGAPCAACCFPTTTPGCPSFVQGYGLCNFCAEGGEANGLCFIKTLYNNSGSLCWLSSCWNWRACNSVLGSCFYPNDAGWCYCSNGTTGAPFWCANMASCGNFACFCDPTPSCRTYYGSSLFSNCYGCSVFGIPGMFPGFRQIATSCATNMCFRMPPIYCLGAGCNVCISQSAGLFGGSCCLENCTGAQAIPGAAGFPTISYSGTCMYGARGRMGMVCVQLV